MKNLLILLMMSLGPLAIAQTLSFESEYEVGEKTFVTGEKIGKNALMLQNAKNINRKSDYKYYRISTAKYDRHKLNEIVLSVFSRERIEEIKKSSPYGVASFWLDLHVNRSGKICAVAFQLKAHDSVTLRELSELEDVLKKEIILSDFLNHETDDYEYFNVSLALKLHKISEGSFGN